MSWSKKYFSPDDIKQGYDKNMEQTLLKHIMEDTERVQFYAAFKTKEDKQGGFTAYFTPSVIAYFDYLERNYVLVRCDKPDADSVTTWIGVEPLASRMLL